MFFGNKVEKILKNKNGSDAIIEIDNLLSPIFHSKPEKLTADEKNFVYIEEFEREINNGGFNQYFSNYSGDYVTKTLNALEIIESKIFTKLLKEAINNFPKGIVPKEKSERIKMLENTNEELWNELDNEFYKYEEDINTLIINYINKNIKEFR